MVVIYRQEIQLKGVLKMSDKEFLVLLREHPELWGLVLRTLQDAEQGAA